MDEKLKEFTQNFEAEKQHIQSQQGTVEQRQERLREIQSEMSQVGQELDKWLHKQAEQNSRLRVLEQLQAAHEGFNPGTLAALKQSEQVVGSLLDQIQVPDQYIKAIETVLGRHLQLVIVENPDTALQILDDLTQNQKGRASIAALSLIADSDEETLAQTSTPFTRARDVIQAAPQVQGLLKRLIGRTLIVSHLDAATSLWKETQGAFDCVTERGDMLDRYGIFTGGKGNGHDDAKSAASLLGRKNEIVELNQNLEELQSQIEQISRKKGGLQSEQTELQASLQEAQSELKSQEVAIATREGEF